MLEHLDTLKIDWAKQIRKNLNEYSLEEDSSIIKEKTVGTWKTEVKKTINKRNRKTLKQNCTKRENGKNAAKDKTKEIYEILEINTDELEIQKILQHQNKKNTQIIIMAISRMFIYGRTTKEQ